VSKINEWELLKDRFDALTHDDSAERIEEIFDAQCRRRFCRFDKPDYPTRRHNSFYRLAPASPPAVVTLKMRLLTCTDVRYWPKADIASCAKHVRF
jgi:hypothetical protein